MAQWGFLTNHTRVLLYMARQPGARIRDVAQDTGLTERAIGSILSELTRDGYLTKHRVGARNFYELHPDQPLRGAGENGHQVGELLELLLDRGPGE